MKKSAFIEMLKKDGIELIHIILGTILIVGGIIGLFLPFLQGILMILAGLYLLGGRKLVKKIKNYFIKKDK